MESTARAALIRKYKIGITETCLIEAKAANMCVVHIIRKVKNESHVIPVCSVCETQGHNNTECPYLLRVKK